MNDQTICKEHSKKDDLIGKINGLDNEICDIKY